MKLPYAVGEKVKIPGLVNLVEILEWGQCKLTDYCTEPTYYVKTQAKDKFWIHAQGAYAVTEVTNPELADLLDKVPTGPPVRRRRPERHGR